MARTEFAVALNQICGERGLEPETVLETLKTAVLAAYRKDYGKTEAAGVEVQIDPQTGQITLLKEGKDITPPGFGRIATQTAKQVILQRIREEEKKAILADFEGKVGEIIGGMILRREGKDLVVDLGRTEGFLPFSQQVPNESYPRNKKLKFYLLKIEGSKKKRIILSRSSPQLVAKLIAQEVPEVHSGVVKIKGVVREAGFRSKVAVASDRAGVDPVGSCVGRQGIRIHTVISELGGQEKVDVIPYSDDPAQFVASALSPAQNLKVVVDQKQRVALVTAPSDQLSLAIGKDGRNARLAAKLTGYRVEVSSKEKSELGQIGLSPKIISALKKADIDLEKLRRLSDAEILAIRGLGKKSLEEIRKKLDREK